MVIGVAAVAAPARAAGEDVRPCEPPCAAGAICLNGTCMMPAQPATAVRTSLTRPRIPSIRPIPPRQTATRHPLTPPPLTTPRTPRSGGFQPVLYAGVHALSGAGTSGTDPGLRLGAILGGRATEVVSANGEITIDIFNFNTSPGGSASGAMVQMTLSPLFHAATASADIVIGPKLGAWALTSHASAGGVSTDVDGAGVDARRQRRRVFPVGPGQHRAGHVVQLRQPAGHPRLPVRQRSGEQCSGDVDGDFNIFSLTFAAML